MLHSARTLLARRSRLLVGTGVLALAGLASAWTVGGTGPFTLPPGTAKSPPLWTGPKTTRTAIKVRVNAGKAEVQQPGGKAIAELPAGSVCIWEGNFEGFNVANPEESECSLFTQIVTEEGPSAYVGAGIQGFPLPSGARFTDVYRSDQPRARLMRVETGAAPLVVLSGTEALLDLEAGDQGLALRTGTTFRMGGGAAAAEHSFWIYDPTQIPGVYGEWPASVTLNAQAGDTGDALYLDGTVRVRVTLRNDPSSPGPLTITSSHACTPSVDVAAGGMAVSEGPLKEFRWVCLQQGTVVHVDVQPLP